MAQSFFELFEKLQKVNLKKQIPRGVFFLLLFSSFFLQCCAPVSVQQSSRPFGPEKISDLISMSRDQERQVHALFSLGRLAIKRRGSEAELNMLAAGIRDSGKIKIEITHPWGRPFLYILLHERRFQILSFSEKKYYSGYLGSFDPSGLFPGMLEPDQIWTFVRGYPVIRKHNRAVSLKENQITVLNTNGEFVQVIDFHPQSSTPCSVLFPEQDIRLTFSDFKNEDGIYYARKVGLSDPRTGSDLTFDRKQVVFNKAIPKEIFQLEKPVGFETPLPQSTEER
jgi:hypothetical protein